MKLTRRGLFTGLVGAAAAVKAAANTKPEADEFVESHRALTPNLGLPTPWHVAAEIRVRYTDWDVSEWQVIRFEAAGTRGIRNSVQVQFAPLSKLHAIAHSWEMREIGGASREVARGLLLPGFGLFKGNHLVIPRGSIEVML